jgi:hypothetical protein
MDVFKISQDSMVPTKRITWFKTFLHDNNFSEKFCSYIKAQAKTERSSVMAEELTAWYELHEDEVLRKVAIMLDMVQENYMKPQHVLPVLQWISFHETFGQGITPRYQQFISLLMSALHQDKWIVTNDAKGIVSHLECPIERDVSYSSAPTDWWLEEDVTGKFLSRCGSHGLDHNNEALMAYSSVPLRVTESWLEKPEYFKPMREHCNSEEEFKNKLKTWENYTSKLVSAVTETAKESKPIYLPHIYDKRYRMYVTVECLNIHQNKQARTVLELYESEKVEGFEIPDETVEADIPALD